MPSQQRYANLLAELFVPDCRFRRFAVELNFNSIIIVIIIAIAIVIVIIIVVIIK